VKKIVAAWIEQILEFPTKLEYLAYIESLKKGKPQKFKETSFEQLESGVVRITIRKQYNNNAFPDDEKEGEESADHSSTLIPVHWKKISASKFGIALMIFF
jgi:hypothetical protein